jgi:predicted ABC-type ATPase
MEQNKPIFHMVRGVPGSGKSTLAKTFNCLNLEADMFHMRDGKYDWKAETARDAHDWCEATFQEALRQRMDVCVSNTFCKNSNANKYLRWAQEAGYQIIIHECYSQFGNVHNVPASVQENMQKNFTPIDEEYLDRIGVTAEVIKYKVEESK